MAKKKIKQADIPMLGDAPIDPKSYLDGKEASPAAPAIPYNLRRELETICGHLGHDVDQVIANANGNIQTLEKICCDANYPRDAWRERYNGELK